MKKIISLFLCLFILTGTFACLVTANAVSLSAGIDALRAEFQHGRAMLDYVYYSPVKDENDTTKYPLVFWLHGNSSGDYPGHQLENCNIHNWASDEFQSRFKETGGAFLFLPRDSTAIELGLVWDLTLSAAKSSLDSFIQQHSANIDTNKIYVGGYSMGGKGVYRMAIDYPGTFAAIFPMSAVYAPTKLELRTLTDTAVWIFSNINDKYPQLQHETVKSNFNYIAENSSHPENCRWTAFNLYHRPDGSTDSLEVHNTWTPVLNDLFMSNGDEYYHMETIDGTGKKIRLTYPDGFISWLSSQSLDGDEDKKDNKNIFTIIIHLFVSLINMIVSLFGTF